VKGGEARAGAAALILEGVHKSFGENEVLRGIDLVVEPHEVVCLIGASGSGKSTLLKCVNLTEPVDSGRIVVEGEEITAPGVDVNRVRRRIGIVFQAFNLFPHMTVLQNVTVRALAMRPSLMLFDEVTSALDPELVAEVLGVIRELADEGMTMLIATHEMGFARDIANRVCFLSEGGILEQGPPEKIFTSPEDPRTRRFLQRIIAAGRL
jgi:polar amino acid transport system ATP-binding protein